MEENKGFRLCNKCNTVKSNNEFSKNKSKKDGLNIYCKQCENNKSKQYRLLNQKEIVEYRNNNREIAKINAKNYRKNNSEKVKKAYKEWCTANPDKSKNATINWQKRNKDRIKANIKLRRETDPLFRLKHNLRVMLSKSFKNKGYTKTSKTCEIMNTTFEDFKKYIEAKFEVWMNWDNYGLYNGELNYGWDIDHIIPLSSAKNEKELLTLNHYTNLQPLCSYINRVVKRDLTLKI